MAVKIGVDALKRVDTAKINLTHPVTGDELRDDEGKPAWIEVYGVDSDFFQKATRKQADKAVKRSGFRPTVKSAAAVDNEQIEHLASVTAGWDNIALDGALLPFTPENAKRLYAREPWIREQVNIGASNRANFFVTPETTEESTTDSTGEASSSLSATQL